MGFFSVYHRLPLLSRCADISYLPRNPVHLVPPEVADLSRPQARVQQENNEDAVPQGSCFRDSCH